MTSSRMMKKTKKMNNGIAIVRTFAYNKGRMKYKDWRILAMAKTANLYARIEPNVKEQAEAILAALGIPASNAITMFYKQIILQRGIPFEMKLPTARPVDVSELSEDQLHAELQKGYDDALAGRTKPASDVFAAIRRDYGV